MITNIIQKSENSPIDLKILKSFLKVANDHENDLIEQLVKMAIYLIEEKTQKMLTETTIEVKHYNNKITLPYSPIISIISVTKNDKNIKISDAPSQTSYSLIKKYGDIVGIETMFSSKKDELVTVRYKAGYSMENLPKIFQNSIISLVSYMYHNREDFSKIEENKDNILQKFTNYALS
jgi:uncharacterized phiE125 gp8 family phage protein